LIANASRAKELVYKQRLHVAASNNIGVYLLQTSIEAFRLQMGLDNRIWIAPIIMLPNDWSAARLTLQRWNRGTTARL